MARSVRSGGFRSAMLAFAMVASLVVVLPQQPAQAATILVCPDGDSDPACSIHTTLADAVSAAADGDDIVLKAGTYVETSTTQWVNKNLTVTGAGSGVTIIDGSALGFRVMNVWGDMIVAINALTITGGSAGASMGGAVSLAPFFSTSAIAPVVTMTDVEITGNGSASNGGGIENNGADLTLDSSDVIDNASGANGGGIYTYNGGSLTLIDTTVAGNAATGGSPGPSAGNGGGVYHASTAGSLAIQRSVVVGNDSNFQGGGLWINSGNNVISNSTIAQNSTNGGGVGGGILIGSNVETSVLINNTTISENSASQGGGIWADTTTVTKADISNSILYGNTSIVGGTQDCSGGVNVSGPVIIGIYNCAATIGAEGSVSSVDPGLSALGLNGGDRLNYTPASPGSAVDTGFAAAAPGSGFPACEALDQNLNPRAQGVACDLGSIEAASASVIQDLIDAAAAGATITLPPGTYTETIIIGADKKLVGGGASPADTVIDAGGSGRTVTLSGNATLENLTITGGSSPTSGGNILNDSADLVLVDVIVSNGSAQSGGNIANGGAAFLSITGSTITGGQAAASGGGILNTVGSTLNVVDSTITGNSAAVGDGGGIANVDGYSFVTDTLLTGNSAGDGAGRGGAVYSDGTGQVDLVDTVVANNTAEFGGGVYSAGTLSVDGSTFASNTANGASGTTGGGIGGAGTVDVVNSTFNDNQSFGNGGGIGLTSGVATINNVTLTNNVAAGRGASFNGDPASEIRISNSLVAFNSNGVGGPNCASLVSLGNNVLGGNPDGCLLKSSDVIATGPIAALGNNGGPTLTRAIAPGHPAIDAGAPVLDYQVFDFTTLGDWQLNGFTDNAGGELLLAAGTFNVGSAFVSDPVPADQDFSAQFDFRIVPDTGGGADGITFTISDDPTVLGQAGGYLGIGRTDPIELVPVGVVNGVSVEFDTWLNGPGEGANDAASLDSGNHIGIDVGGSLSSIAFNTSPIADLSDGSVWTAWIDYDAEASLLEVRASNTGVRPAAPTVSATVDIAAELGGTTGYVGFTGATGSTGISGQQRVRNLTFSSGVPCEPVDQRNQDRPGGEQCDSGAYEFTAPTIATGLSVDISDAGSVASDIPVFPIDDLDVGTFFGVSGPTSTQLGAIQLGAIQLGAIDASGLTAASGHLTLETIIDAAGELTNSRTVLDRITLVDMPVAGGWEPILALSSTLSGRPPYTVTLQQVIDDPAIEPTLRDLRLADSGIASTQLGAIQLGAIQLGAIQLGAIQLGAIQLGAIGDQLTDICAAGDIDCVALGIVPNDSTTYDDYSIMALTLLGVELDFAQLGAIQLGAIDPSGTQLGAIQLGAIQLGAIDLEANTIGNTQLGAIQLGAIQLGAIQLGAIQLGAIGTKAGLVDYWCNDPAGGLDCEELGVDTVAFTGDELDSYSLVALGAMGADLSVLQLGAIQLGAIDNLENTQLGAIQLGAIQLGAIDIQNTQLGAIQLGAIGPNGAQLGAIQLGAIQLGAIQLGAISPAATQLGAIQLGAIQLGAIDSSGNLVANQLGAIQLGAIQLGAINGIESVIDCSLLAGGCSANGDLTLLEVAQLGAIKPDATLQDLEGAFGDVTLQDLGDAGVDINLVYALLIADFYPETTIAELPPELTLDDIEELWVGIPLYELLLALMDPADLAWEDVDPAVIAADNPVLIAGWSTTFTMAGEPGLVPGAEFPFSAEVTVALPEGVTYVPGSAALSVNPQVLPPPTSPLPDPEIDGNTLRWIIDDVELNDLLFIGYSLATAFTADTSTPIATTVNTIGFTATDSLPTFITDIEPNDTFATATPVSGDVVVLGRADTPGDIDLFELTVPAGGTVEAYLNPGGVDLDLVLFEPGQTSDGELRGPAERVVDGSLDPVIGLEIEQDQESLDDIPNTDAAPVFKSSLHRGDATETIITPPLRNGGTFYLQVTSYNGAASDEVYVGRIRVIDPPAAGTCLPRVLPFAGDGSPGTLPAGAELSSAETVYLMNTELYADTYGSAALTDVLTAIAGVNGVGPQGVVIPVEGDPAVAAAYAAWLDAPGACDVDAANAVATAIADLVDGYRADHPAIASIVIVGGDDQIPFFRVEDQGVVANEREYLPTFDGNNPLTASLRDGMVLTDAPYTDANPLYVPQGDREVFVSQLPTGRLVEEPIEVIAALDQYVASGGLLDTATAIDPAAEVLGYDFLADSSTSIADELTLQGFTVNAQINETWTEVDLEAAYDSQAAIVNGNAHFDHTAALPALGNLQGNYSALYTVSDLDPVTSSIYAGTIIYTMGCHAGLNAPGAYLDPLDPLYDWAQALLAREAVYLANTGFGYGDSDIQAYSEELMTLFTEQFATSNTVGEAFRNAQQLFAAQTPKWSPYHDKSLMEATLYGLPFYRLGATPVTPPELMTVDAAPVGGSGLEAYSVSSSTPLTAGGGLTEDRYLIADDVLAVPFRPVQPLEYIEVTEQDPALRATGAIIEAGSSHDLLDFDVLYARPIVYDEDAEPQVKTDGAFPNALQAITSYESPSGRVDQLLLARGRYFPTTQTQQSWDSVDLTVYYGPVSSTDVDPPNIERVSAVETAPGVVDFAVDASDGSGVLRAVVLYKPEGANGAWTKLELTESNGTWVGQAAGVGTGTDLEFFVQVLDGAGLVATSTDKAELHDVVPPNPPGIVVDGAAGNNGIYTSGVSVTLTESDNAPGANLEISIDGGQNFDPYSQPVALFADGTYEVVARVVGFAESGAETQVVIDRTAPTITLVSPLLPASVAQFAPLQLEYFCTDSFGGSGVASCKGTVVNGAPLDTTVPGTREAQVTATDRAGNVTTTVVPYLVTENIVPVILQVTGPVDPVAAGAPTSITVQWVDPDAEGHSIDVDWGDGTSSSTQSSGGSTIATAEHTYQQPGVYTVTATVTDAGGASSESVAYQFIVVYDPNGGFVTGGGWINSPPGAYTPGDATDEDVVGKASFGFVAKYKKGQDIPDGNTQFKFKAAGLEFESTSYEWLVVAGARAQYKGEGIIGGENGTYGFMLTAIDAALTPSTDVDLFRIKIWDKATGDVVYDNQLGASDDADLTTAIGGGSIVIHQPKGKK